VSWSLRFAEPIVLADGAKLATLRQAIAHLVKTIPAAETAGPSRCTSQFALRHQGGRKQVVTPAGAMPWIPPCACRKSNPNILVVQPAQDRAAKNGPGQFDGARDRRILLQR